MGVPGLWLAKGSCQGRQNHFFLRASLALSLITVHVRTHRDQRPSLGVIPPWDLEFPEELDPSACLTPRCCDYKYMLSCLAFLHGL